MEILVICINKHKNGDFFYNGEVIGILEAGIEVCTIPSRICDGAGVLGLVCVCVGGGERLGVTHGIILEWVQFVVRIPL